MEIEYKQLYIISDYNDILTMAITLLVPNATGYEEHLLDIVALPFDEIERIEELI